REPSVDTTAGVEHVREHVALRGRESFVQLRAGDRLPAARWRQRLEPRAQPVEPELCTEFEVQPPEFDRVGTALRRMLHEFERLRAEAERRNMPRGRARQAVRL